MLDLSLAINIGTRIGGFSPATLFAASEPGGWYDIDPAYLFQDSAGTTPVTAPGQTVGMVLDRSKGLVLGPELVTNGDFSSGSTGWTVGTNWSVGSGIASKTAGAAGNLSQSAGIVNGRFYQITFALTVSGGSVWVNVGSSGSFSNAQTTGGNISLIVAANGATGAIEFQAGSGAVATVDNISVKELPGNHLTQSSLSNRAIYGVEPIGGRRNLLTYTEQFDDAAWTKVNAAISANVAVAPDGTTTADRLTASTTGAQLYQTVTLADSTTYAASVYLKKGAGSDWAYIRFRNKAGGNFYLWANLATGVVGSTSGSPTSFSFSAAGNGWYRLSVVASSGTGATTPYVYVSSATGDTAGSPAASDELLVWGAQLEAGSTATAYQRVVTAFDVTEAGVPSLSYIQFDGSDDWLVSPTITPGIDKAQVFAGVRTLADTTGSIAETSADSSTNNGAFSLFTLAGADDVQLLSRGTTAVNIRHDGATEPFTAVYAGTADIAADGLVLRSNGTQVNQSTSDQGTGNYLAYPLYVGRRGGTSLPYNGRIYSLIVRFGANLSASTITQTENWVAGKTGITI